MVMVLRRELPSIADVSLICTRQQLRYSYEREFGSLTIASFFIITCH